MSKAQKTTTGKHLELHSETVETVNTQQAEQMPLLNDKELHDFIHNSMDEIMDIEEQRKSLNADINAIRKKLVAQGICIESFNYAFALYKKDPDERKGYDLSLVVCQNACGVGFQQDLLNR